MLTNYDADIVGSIFPQPDEDTVLLQLGESDPGGLGFSSFASFYITMNTSILWNVTIDQVWTNMRVERIGSDGTGRGSFRVVNDSDPNNANYVSGMTTLQINNITTSIDYVTDYFFSNGVTHIIALGDGAVSNLTSLKDTGFFSIAIKETVNAGDDEAIFSFINATDGGWPSHFFAEYDCTPPSEGVWTLNVTCIVQDENFEVDGLIIGPTGFLDMRNSFMNVTGIFDIEGGIDLSSSGIDVG